MGYFSNGTEGEMFEEAWCSRSVHSDISGEREIGVDPPCPVWMAHIMFAYEECNASSNAKAILDMLIEDHRGRRRVCERVRDVPPGRRRSRDPRTASHRRERPMSVAAKCARCDDYELVDGPAGMLRSLPGLRPRDRRLSRSRSEGHDARRCRGGEVLGLLERGR